MGGRGRFGKYGESKRIDRLRQARICPKAVCGKGPSHKTDERPDIKKRLREQQIRIRQARPSDVEYIRGLSRRVFSRFGPYEEILPSWFESGVTVTLMALKRGKPVGFVMLGLPSGRPYPPGVSELMAIAVEPGARRLGIGGLLIQEAEKGAGELEIKHLVLFTALDNSAAQSLFTGNGFTRAGIREGFYPRGQDAMMMEKVIP